MRRQLTCTATSQLARDRNLVALSAGTARVLAATDIAARGVHLDDVELAVHVDPPVEHKAYPHRSGRHPPRGNTGDVVTVVLPEQRRELQLVMRKAGISGRSQEVSAHSQTTSVGRHFSEPEGCTVGAVGDTSHATV